MQQNADNLKRYNRAALGHRRKVYGLCARPDIASTVIEGGKVNVEGIMEVEVLYSPADCTPPITSFKHIHEKFSQVVDCDGIDQSTDMMCDVNISVGSTLTTALSQAMSLAGEFRIIASLDTRIISKSNVSYVSDSGIETEEFGGKSDQKASLAKQKHTVIAFFENFLHEINSRNQRSNSISKTA